MFKYYTFIFDSKITINKMQAKIENSTKNLQLKFFSVNYKVL